MPGVGGGCQTLVCLDRKQSPLTFDPGPLCHCESVRLFIFLVWSRTGSFSRRLPRNRWSCFPVPAVCAGAHVSCPEVHRGSHGVAVFITAVPMGSGEPTLPKRNRWREGKRKSRIVRCKTSALPLRRRSVCSAHRQAGGVRVKNKE